MVLDKNLILLQPSQNTSSQDKSKPKASRNITKGKCIPPNSSSQAGKGLARSQSCLWHLPSSTSQLLLGNLFQTLLPRARHSDGPIFSFLQQKPSVPVLGDRGAPYLLLGCILPIKQRSQQKTPGVKLIASEQLCAAGFSPKSDFIGHLAPYPGFMVETLTKLY